MRRGSGERDGPYGTRTRRRARALVSAALGIPIRWAAGRVASGLCLWRRGRCGLRGGYTGCVSWYEQIVGRRGLRLGDRLGDRTG